jgi:hypothetical protein
VSDHNQLDAVVRRIKEVHANEAEADLAIANAEGNRRHCRCMIGELLIEAKAALEHGQWLPWLNEHFGWDERTAQRYMKEAGDPAAADAVRAADAERKRSSRATKNDGQTPRPSDLTSKGDALAAINNARPNPQPERWAATAVGKPMSAYAVARETPLQAATRTKLEKLHEAFSECDEEARLHFFAMKSCQLVSSNKQEAIRALWRKLTPYEQATLLDELTAPETTTSEPAAPVTIETVIVPAAPEPVSEEPETPHGDDGGLFAIWEPLKANSRKCAIGWVHDNRPGEPPPGEHQVITENLVAFRAVARKVTEAQLDAFLRRVQ